MKKELAPSTAEIRAAFLDYFASKKHAVVPSAPLVPRDDPTLLFVNAGMVPFKDAFTGHAKAPAPRAASSQRCLRVSGKHNDLDEVGRTPRHHTLFEMLGNFSFGDYFKEGAIAFAWEFLVDRLKLDPKRLVFTVFAGEGEIPPDDEAAEIWKRVAGVGDDRVLRFGTKDNFWAMGDTGPCGPCSEIHYDLGAELPGEVNRGARFMEIWNLVFMQYDRSREGALAPLPKPSIDTGMGLERIASVVQGKTSNYDADLLRSLLGVVAEIVGRRYEGGDDSDSVSMRVIVDHARATAFLLADQVHPDKTGRGYVLRKIMRRAISHGVLLDVHRPFLADACAAVADSMGESHPVLRERLALVRRGADAEEALFRRTVEEGMRRIDELLEELENDRVWRQGEDGSRVLAGDVAFRLYDTHGCPLELTASVGVRRGFQVDEAGFFAAMEAQRERSRASWKGGGDADAVRAFFAGRQEVGGTAFRGWERLDGESVVRALGLVHGDEIVPAERAGEGATVVFATADTPFYGEAGGQVGDTGVVTTDGGRIRVEDVKRTAGGEVFVHFGTVEEGEIAAGATVAQQVDPERRRRVADHHSSTHLVHWALRDVLGTHVAQKGSYVGPDRLRFDFSHSEAVRPDELAAIEDRVNDLLRENHEVATDVLPYAEALRRGALAFFGDKYGDVVRMVSMGPSRELCGGTHVRATGDVGLFSFASEGSVASGVRRIEAFAGPSAVAHARRAREMLERIAGSLRAGPDDALERVRELQEETKRLRRRIEELEREAAGDAAGELSGTARQVAGHRLISGRAPVASHDALRDLGDRLRASGPSTVVVLGAEIEGKVALLAALSDDVVQAGRLTAGDLVGRV
ncbi:MAG: alanine--tRNA ligase, partial [bacterium]